MIGLSSGSLAQVVAHHPDVEALEIVEINPGYLNLIAEQDEVASLLDNANVTIHIDDGRRWLLANPDARFDVIVQNTTYHWRGNVTNLLSREYLEIVRRHLGEGGVFYYNTTGSPHAQRTGCAVFRHGYRVERMVAVSDTRHPFERSRMRDLLARYEIDGRRSLDSSDPVQRERIDRAPWFGGDVRLPDELWLEPCEAVLGRTTGLPLVTDDNMPTEFDELRPGRL